MMDTQRQAEEEIAIQTGFYRSDGKWYWNKRQHPLQEVLNPDVVRVLDLAVREREKNKADLETLAKTMIACELATGHGEDIDSLCLELRTEWEELISKYIFERQKNKAMEERWNMLKQLESSPHPSKKEER